jgi:hypothetical protein
LRLGHEKLLEEWIHLTLVVLAGKLDAFPGKQGKLAILFDEHFVGALHLDFGDEADDKLLQVEGNI